jgi:hypothetical protein
VKAFTLELQSIGRCGEVVIVKKYRRENRTPRGYCRQVVASLLARLSEKVITLLALT